MKTTLLIAMGLAATSVPAAAVDFLSQLPGNGSGVSNAFAAQDFEGSYNAFDVALIDDFTVGSGATVTSVSAAVTCFSGNMCLNAVQNYRVEFYSSVAAAAGNLTGDIGSFTIAAGAATVTHPYAENYAGLVTLTVNQALNSGTYWLGIIPQLDFGANGQSGVTQGSFGGNSNATHVNPNGGFGFPSNRSPYNTDAAYAVSGTLSATPEPEQWALLLVGFAAAGVAMRRRGKRISLA